ncbi:MAG: DUF2292 domain-containing protein [bacterium]
MEDIYQIIKKYLDKIMYGKIVLTVHHGKIEYIEVQEKVKVNN